MIGFRRETRFSQLGPGRGGHRAAFFLLPCSIAALGVVLGLGTTLPGCQSAEKGPTADKYIETREVMGTWATVTLITGNGKRAVAASDAAFASLDSVAALMNPRWETSEIYALNDRGAHEPVKVSPPTLAVLEQSLQMCALSDGAFDVTVGPLIALWQEHGGTGTLPTDEEIATAVALVGPDEIILDPTAGTAALRTAGARVDLGGIAQGYAIDLAVEAIRREGVESGIVEVGGDLRCFGAIPAALIDRDANLPMRTMRSRPVKERRASGTGDGRADVFPGLRRSESASTADPRPWPLGVQDPFAERIMGRIRVGDRAVATSGHYRRFVTIGDQRFSHILDPRTGRPVEDPASVTVIAGTAVIADGLATAITVLGLERGLALAESLPDVEALIISGTAENPKQAATSGFPEVGPVP
jgi:FAD:protein FMN transferase